jgi:hypothetical protein
MNDLPRRVDSHEEGPRERFQIEPAPIATEPLVAACTRAPYALSPPV